VSEQIEVSLVPPGSIEECHSSTYSTGQYDFFCMNLHISANKYFHRKHGNYD